WALALNAARLRAVAELAAALPYVLIVGEGATRYQVLHGEFIGADDDLVADEVRRQHRGILCGRTLLCEAADHADQPGLSTTYCGHTPVPAPFRHRSHVYLDTGASLPMLTPGNPGRLTVIEHGRDPRLERPDPGAHVPP